MKKTAALLLVLIFIIGTLPAIASTKREIWVPSPGFTCGLTDKEIMFNKAVHAGLGRIYRLSAIGEKYCLGVLEEQVTDGGSNGTKDTSFLTYYSLLETDNGFIILGEASVSNEYYWNGYEGVVNISDQIDTEYYTSRGYEAPYYIINPHSKYTYSQWEEYADFIFVGSNGGIDSIGDCVDDDADRYPMVYNNKLYTGQEKYYKSSKVYTYYLSDGETEATQRQIIGIKDDEVANVGSPDLVDTTTVVKENGYKIYKDGMGGNTPVEEYYAFPGYTDRYYKYKYVLKDDVYNCVLSIYKNVEGYMKLIQEETCSTGLTTRPYDTPYKIIGLDESYYLSTNSSVPVLQIGDIFVLKNGKMVRFVPDSTYGNYYFCIYNNRLATVRTRYDGEYVYYRDENDVYRYWQRINCLNFTDDGITIEDYTDIRVGVSTGLDGYYSERNAYNVSSKLVQVDYAPLQSWWPHCLDNKFSDGRYVAGHWTGLGSSIHEVWYDIYDKDGTLISTGATNYSTTYSSKPSESTIRAFVINDTKIIMCHASLSNQWAKEYYRASVVTENDEGIVEVSQPLGKKNLVAPEDADTEPVNSVVDFAADDLTIGFNIKENIIDTDKLTYELREQVDSISLDGITIVKKEGAARGRRIVGFTLPDYNDYDYSFGSEPIYIYTNGTTLNWSCSNPENLEPGVYDQMYYIDGKSFYVTIKVIEPPSNDSVTTVVF